MGMKTHLLASVLALLASFPALAELPLKIELLAPKEPVTLNKAAEAKPQPGRGGRGGADITLPDITLRYRITNTGKEAIVLEHGGDATTNLLVVKGPGAVDVPYLGFHLAVWLSGKPITIGGGETKEFEIKGLKYGKRDMSYWNITKSGDYEVSLTHNTRAGQAKVSLTSEPVKFSVVIK